MARWLRRQGYAVNRKRESFRYAKLIPMLAIPVSIIGTFLIMDLAGFSINVLTLLGLVLAIGLVVDDAIVVLENIYTKIEQGMEPIAAPSRSSPA